jgi:hypothetical protein
MSEMKVFIPKSKWMMFSVLAASLAFSGTVIAKSLATKIPVRFANIKLIVNGQIVQTNAEPFIYNGNVYAPVATIANALGIKQEWDNKTPSVQFSNNASDIPANVVSQALKFFPTDIDYSSPKAPFPTFELITKKFVNITGMSNQEFLGAFTFQTPEGVPFRSDMTLFRYEHGNVKPISTIRLYDDGPDAYEVSFMDSTKEVYVHHRTLKVVDDGTASRMIKTDLKSVAIFGWKDGKLLKLTELSK